MNDKNQRLQTEKEDLTNSLNNIINEKMQLQI